MTLPRKSPVRQPVLLSWPNPTCLDHKSQSLSRSNTSTLPTPLEALDLVDLLRIWAQYLLPHGPLQHFHGPKGRSGHLPARRFHGTRALIQKNKLFSTASPGPFGLTRQTLLQNGSASEFTIVMALIL